MMTVENTDPQPNDGETPEVPVVDNVDPGEMPAVNTNNDDDPLKGLKSALDKERDARKKLEKHNKELLKFKEEQDRLQLDEKERLAADLEKAAKEGADMRKQLHESLLKAEFQSQAVANGVNPLVFDDLLSALSARGTVGVDDEGNVYGISEAIDDLKVSKPIYFSDTTPVPTNINGASPRNNNSGPKLTSDEATAIGWFKGAGVSQEDYINNKNVV